MTEKIQTGWGGGGGGGVEDMKFPQGVLKKNHAEFLKVLKKTQGISISLGFSKGKVTSLKIPGGRGGGGLGVSESISLNPV